MSLLRKAILFFLFFNVIIRFIERNSSSYLAWIPGGEIYISVEINTPLL